MVDAYASVVATVVRLRELLAGPHDMSAGYHNRDCYACATLSREVVDALPALLDALDALAEERDAALRKVAT
jgi:hypothetical protein